MNSDYAGKVRSAIQINAETEIARMKRMNVATRALCVTLHGTFQQAQGPHDIGYVGTYTPSVDADSLADDAWDSWLNTYD